jgi:hypothetical protein
LTVEKFTDMWNRLIDLGQAGAEILGAWIAKEELRALLALARIGARRSKRSSSPHHQRRQRRRQPPDQARSPQRLRLPQPHQPTPTITLRKHPRNLATNQARLTSKTR